MNITKQKEPKKQNTRPSLFIIYAIFILFGITIGTIDPITPVLASELGVSYAKIGLVIFYSIICLLLSNIIAGNLSDRYDMKKIMLTGVILVSMGLFFFGIYLDLYTLIIYLVFIRLGFGILDPVTYNYYSELLSAKNRTSVFIKINLSWFIGLVLGPLIISVSLYAGINPRVIFTFISVIFAALITAFYIVSPGSSKKTGDLKNRHKRSLLLEVFSDPFLLSMGFVYLFYSGAVFGLATWLTTYFLDFGIKVADSSIFLSLYWLASIAGLLVTLKISRKFSEKKIFIISIMAGSLCSILVAFIGVIPVKVLFIFLQGLTLAAVMPLIKTISIKNRPGLAGTIVGFILMFQGIGILVFQPLIGFVADRFGKEYIIYMVISGLVLSSILASANYFKITGRRTPS